MFHMHGWSERAAASGAATGHFRSFDLGRTATHRQLLRPPFPSGSAPARKTIRQSRGAPASERELRLALSVFFQEHSDRIFSEEVRCLQTCASRMSAPQEARHPRNKPPLDGRFFEGFSAPAPFGLGEKDYQARKTYQYDWPEVLRETIKLAKVNFCMQQT